MYPRWINNNLKNYKYVLMHNNIYSNVRSCWCDSFSFSSAKNDKKLERLEKEYKLKKLIAYDSDIKTCLRAMEWTFYKLLGEETEYDGEISAHEILDFCANKKKGVNCLCHATVLTEVLLALGYHARKISCCPIDIVPYDNHVVTSVYIPSIKKWIMLDPSMCCYVRDEDKILSISEIREKLILDEKMEVITFGRFAGIYGEEKTNNKFNSSEYMTYLYKNFFRFMSRKKQNGNATKKGDVVYVLVPKGYLPGNNAYKDFFEGEEVEIRITDNEDFFWNSSNTNSEGGMNNEI